MQHNVVPKFGAFVKKKHKELETKAKLKQAVKSAEK